MFMVCDYTTRHFEAIAIKSMDAEVIAEVLVKIFSRGGIPKEIFDRPGTNFTSKLLSKEY